MFVIFVCHANLTGGSLRFGPVVSVCFVSLIAAIVSYCFRVCHVFLIFFVLVGGFCLKRGASINFRLPSIENYKVW